MEIGRARSTVSPNEDNSYTYSFSVLWVEDRKKSTELMFSSEGLERKVGSRNGT